MDRPPRERIKREIWHPALYEVDDLRAIQAVAEGNASAQEQQRALHWIVMSAAATYEGGHLGADDPNGRLDAFMRGRQAVGQQIVKLMKLKPDLFRTEGELDL